MTHSCAGLSRLSMASPPPSLPPPLSLIERERGVKRGEREEGRRAPTPPLFVPLLLLRPVSRSPRSVLARAPTEEEEQSVRGGRGDRAHVCVASFRDVPAFAGSQRGYFNGYLWGYLCCVDFRHFDVRVWIESQQRPHSYEAEASSREFVDRGRAREKQLHKKSCTKERALSWGDCQLLRPFTFFRKRPSSSLDAAAISTCERRMSLFPFFFPHHLLLNCTD